MIYSGNSLIKIGHITSYLVLGISLFLNMIYKLKYAKDDIAKEEDESHNNAGLAGPDSTRS
jgi:hypothetical protein